MSNKITLILFILLIPLAIYADRVTTTKGSDSKKNELECHIKCKPLLEKIKRNEIIGCAYQDCMMLCNDKFWKE